MALGTATGVASTAGTGLKRKPCMLAACCVASEMALGATSRVGMSFEWVLHGGGVKNLGMGRAAFCHEGVCECSELALKLVVGKELREAMKEEGGRTCRGTERHRVGQQ